MQLIEQAVRRIESNNYRTHIIQCNIQHVV